MPASAQRRVTQAVDERSRQVLAGSRHPFARAEFDRGPAPRNLPMDRMLLVLKRTARQEAELSNLIAQQHDPASPEFGRWLQPEEFGRRFGPADADLAILTRWLTSHGFDVAGVSAGRTLLEFSGTAAQVEEAFRTPIHQYRIAGRQHWANAADPEIPAALAPVVSGIAALHNFRTRPQSVVRPEQLRATVHSGPVPTVTFSSGIHALSPADYATIYNARPVHQNGIDTRRTAPGRPTVP